MNEESSGPAKHPQRRSDLLYTVNTWCTPKNTWLQDIEQSARLGAQGVGLWEGKFEDGDDSAIADALERHDMRAVIVMPRHWAILPTPLDPRANLGWEAKSEGICESIRRLARFKPTGIMIGPGASGDPNRRLGPVEDVAKGLAMVADAAAEYGLRIAFEPIALRRGSPVSTLPETVDLIDAVGRDNVDILLDIFHSWPEENLHASMRKNVHRIIGVQVNDIRNPERSWCDRVLPGDGRNMCTPILATLIDAGYKGWYDFEVFSDDGRWGNDFPDSLWKMPHEEFLRRGHEAFLRCYADAEKMLEDGIVPHLNATA